MMDMKKLQTYIGLVLVVVTLGAFAYILIVNIPSQSTVNQQATTIPAIPSNLFSSSNPLVSKLNALTVPSGTPVVVNPSDIGRTNIFQSY